MNISLDTTNINNYIDATYLDKADSALNLLKSGKGKGNDFIGWLTLAEDTKKYVNDINSIAKEIKINAQALIVIGIGGSYLGAKAGLDFLKSPNYNALNKDTPDLYFVGNNLSADYINEVISMIGDKDFYINVISKSGTTLEPAISFRIFRDLLIKKYGKDNIKDKIIATTDAKSGTLKELADKEGYRTLIVPNNVGGRYSVLSPVGLLPLAVAGIDTQELLNSASDFIKSKECESLAKKYAAIRNNLYDKGKEIELLSSFDPKLASLSEWWKQLFGESEGKDGKGLFPASVTFTTDLHSMGQYIQDGRRIIFESFISVLKNSSNLEIPFAEKNEDNLNFLSRKDLALANNAALEGTKIAHLKGGVPNLEIRVKDFSEKSFAELISFYELACAISGYMLDVNPFDQPGVEEYKKNMFKILESL